MNTQKDTDQLELFSSSKGIDRSQPQFDLGIKQPKKRPLWKDAALFTTTVLGAWMMIYGAMNYNALGQLAEFKWQRIKTSVVNTTEEIQKSFEPELLEVNTGKKPHIKNNRIETKNNAPLLFKNLEVLPSDNRIYIPSIDKNIPLIDVPNHKNWKTLENDIQTGLQNGVVVHPISRDPGNFGNFFVTGHSSYYAWDKGRYKDVFALLHEVGPGEDVHIFWEGKKFVYRLGEKKVIDPSEVGVLNQPKDEKMITLMTCTPIGTNKKRLILTGELIEES